jgi:hypothetical protein
VHRLTVGLYAVAYDDQDNVIGTFDPPPPLFIPPDPGRPPDGPTPPSSTCPRCRTCRPSAAPQAS